MQQNNKTNLEKRSPKRANNTTLLAHLWPPSSLCLLCLSLSRFSPKRFTQSSVRISIYHIIMYLVNLLFSPFMFGIVLKVSVRLVKWSFTVVTYIMRKIENFWRIVFCCWGVCLPQGLWECLSISGQVWPWVMRIWKTKRSFMFLQLIWRFLCFLTGYISEVTKHYFGDSVIRKHTHSVWESLELCTRTLAAVCLSLLSGMHFFLFSNV